ncbi:phospho-N-acetylmuramoyl-pentapeptide-transferase [Aureibacter tunicatorum]|uniref:Phospho-N-acetylmuramoyl-pentapeptide-transferase n=1 Tax=Aureibacter tunicatorum TaxID=866807 RepID=A0AAE3XRF1_9BACT|nr:phospho-N-acetylmuramoyl-pentapeptide-transferase [Aureibacter tunicatorum]MDR6241237.1 phospho-N-acetylmuramoyl-pentapeptide-transferase [Aureibacter tunicatorum]BDD03497.1 phospho-N-acetylmuramoyl-pentapeptide-transferase [Aureibacter tunicatorum]
MFYYLFDYLKKTFDLAGAGVFQYITFRAGAAMFASLIITIFFGKAIIDKLHRLQVGESIRDLGLEGQMEKKGTPTMGGIMIIMAIVIPTILFAQLDNIYIILLIVSTLWMGVIGFLDDYIKVFRKNKEGLAGRFKIVGQVGLGLIVGLTLYFHEDVVVRINDAQDLSGGVMTAYHDIKSTVTTIPFLKNNEFDYSMLLPFLPDSYTWIVYVLVVIFIVTAVSNGANITDGIDGLAAGVSAVIGIVLAIFAYLSGNAIFADYLNIMYIPMSGELVIFCAAFIGACIGFLWYNSFPAQVFMGDTGSLSIGGVIAVMALVVKKELLIPILCGVFLIENLSVIIQVGYFKYTKKKYGEGRRVFKMAPLHHHYQKMGIHESKIVSRFIIVTILLAILTLTTLKLR